MAKKVNFEIPAGLFLVPMELSFATTDLQSSDVVLGDYLPGPCTVYGVHYSATDMDTNVSPTLVQKVTIGSTDVATGLSGGQTGTASYVAISPITLTAATQVSIGTTTGAATAAAGTVKLAFLCQK